MRATAENFFSLPCASLARTLNFLRGAEILGQALEIEDFETGKAKRFEIVARQKFKGEHAHSNQVAAMDALKAFRQHRADPKKNRALGGPVAAMITSRIQVSSGDHHQRHAFFCDTSWLHRRWSCFHRRADERSNRLRFPEQECCAGECSRRCHASSLHGFRAARRRN